MTPMPFPMSSRLFHLLDMGKGWLHWRRNRSGLAKVDPGFKDGVERSIENFKKEYGLLRKRGI